MLIDETLKKQIAPTTIEFIAREDGTALDSMSGLTWCRYLIGQTWMKRRALGDALELPLTEVMQAIEEFNTQKFGGFRDWRLPTQAELDVIENENIKIISNDRSLFGENEIIFSRAPKKSFWTASALLAQTSNVEIIVGYYGGKTARTQFSSKYVRLVRG
jgi:hypothetical protein